MTEEDIWHSTEISFPFLEVLSKLNIISEQQRWGLKVIYLDTIAYKLLIEEVTKWHCYAGQIRDNMNTGYYIKKIMKQELIVENRVIIFGFNNVLARLGLVHLGFKGSRMLLGVLYEHSGRGVKLL